MSYARAVYSSKPVLTGRRLIECAADLGWTLRLLLMGGGIPSEPQQMLGNLKQVNSGGILIVGADSSAGPVLEKFDTYSARRDRVAIAKLLNAFELPWIELLTAPFRLEKFLQTFPRSLLDFEKSVPPDRWDEFQSAKVRYILSNESRHKACTPLMQSLAEAIARASSGLLIKHSMPKR